MFECRECKIKKPDSAYDSDKSIVCQQCIADRPTRRCVVCGSSSHLDAEMFHPPPPAPIQRPSQTHVYASWLIAADDMPEDLDDFHISCGQNNEAEDDDQFDGFFPLSDAGAALTIEDSKITTQLADGETLETAGFTVTFTAPAAPLFDAVQFEDGFNYWLSPNSVGQAEADFGLCNGHLDALQKQNGEIK
jgi:hypothetical protein